MFQIIEIMATFLENLLAFSAVTEMSQPKVKGKKRCLLILLFSGIMTVVITALNYVEAFSFLTIAVAFFAVTFFCRFTTEGGLIRRATATVIVYLCIHATDYVLVALFGLIERGYTSYTHTFQEILLPGFPRLMLLLLSKSIDISLYCAFKKHMPALGRLERRYGSMILVFGSIAYVLMSFLLGLVQEESAYAIQTAFLLVWLLLVVCVIAIACMFVIITNYKASEQRNTYLRTTNELMVENYKKLNDIQQTIRRQVHDFNHHLRILQELADSQDIGKVADYLNSLLEAPKNSLTLCRCGNDVIDAVINCKAMDASANGIDFHYSVEYDSTFVIDPVDLCAILSNQIANALEACQKLPPDAERRVDVKIWPQNGEMLFLQVFNSVESNPFEGNENLHTTKEDPYHLHGYGIQNIRDTAAKYDGDLKSAFQNGRFVSTVYLFCEHSHE